LRKGDYYQKYNTENLEKNTSTTDVLITLDSLISKTIRKKEYRYSVIIPEHIQNIRHLLEGWHTAKTQVVENRRKDIAIHQEFHGEPKAASCSRKLFLAPKRNQEWSGTGRGIRAETRIKKSSKQRH
jgi:hypothetical protein